MFKHIGKISRFKAVAGGDGISAFARSAFAFSGHSLWDFTLGYLQSHGACGFGNAVTNGNEGH